MSLNLYRSVNPYYTTNYINGIRRNGDEGFSPYISTSSETERSLVSNNLNKIVKPISEEELSHELKLAEHLDMFALRQRRNETIGKLNMAFEQALENLNDAQENLANPLDRHKFVTESYELTESTEEPSPKRRKLNIARQLKNNQPVTFDSEPKEKKYNELQFRAKLQSFFPAKELSDSEAFFSSLANDEQKMILDWITEFRFFNVDFLVKLISFLTTYQEHMDTCKSILNTPDYYLNDGLDCSGRNASVEERVQSMRHFMNSFISSKRQNHKLIYY